MSQFELWQQLHYIHVVCDMGVQKEIRICPYNYLVLYEWGGGGGGRVGKLAHITYGKYSSSPEMWITYSALCTQKKDTHRNCSFMLFKVVYVVLGIKS